jgi:hypothetical protein
MSEDIVNPTLDILLDLVIEKALAGARAMLPGRITSYDAVKQRASVQILIQEAHIDELDVRRVQTIPEVHEVPVWFFGAQAGGRITVPVGTGDQGMVHFASASIARWKLRGGIVDPGDDTKHSINDCVFVPGLHDYAHVPTTAPTDAIVLHGNVKIGGPIGTEPTFKATSWMTAFDTLIAAIATAVGTSGTPAGATAAGTAITAALTQFHLDVVTAKTTNTEVK